jgi:hypothetical protein
VKRPLDEPAAGLLSSLPRRPNRGEDGEMNSLYFFFGASTMII